MAPFFVLFAGVQPFASHRESVLVGKGQPWQVALVSDPDGLRFWKTDTPEGEKRKDFFVPMARVKEVQLEEVEDEEPAF